MIFARCWLWLLLVAGALVPAHARSGFRFEKGVRPLHPTVIYAEYKGKQLPIVGVRSDNPQVSVEGKRVTLATNERSRYTPQRGSEFAPGSIQLRNMRAGGSKTRLVLMYAGAGEVDGGVIQANSDFSATLTPSRDYKDCYVALVFFDQGYLDGSTEVPAASVRFKKIKDLTGGRENKISLTFDYLNFGDRLTGFFPLFFSEGREIRSSEAELIAQFFYKMEQTLHDAIVRGYLAKNAGKSAALQPYLRIAPLFIDEAVEAAAPGKIDVSFIVAEDGRVESLELQEPLDPAVAAVLRPTMHAWRFLPRLKEGYATRSMVRTTLLLKDAK